jgi:hypothetical protein
LVYGAGNTGAWADIDIAEMDLPAVGTMRITAADSSIMASCPAQPVTIH